MKIIYSIILIIFCSGMLYSSDRNSFSKNSASLSFIQNKAQTTDQNGQPRTDIQFTIKAGRGLNIFIGNGAIHYQFCKSDSNMPLEQENACITGLLQFKNHTPENTNYTMYRLDVELIGANKNAKIVMQEKQDYFENYLSKKGSGQFVTANSYKKIVYKNIYPNIDWVLSTSTGQLEYEFIVRAGGNTNDIQLKYSGATDLKINDNGSLTAVIPQGTIIEQAPICYQLDGKGVQGRFKMNDNILTYKTGNYNGVLVIDPTLLWSTYFGGTNNENGNGIAADDSGNIYITGNTSSSSNIATTGAYEINFNGSSDAFLAKFDSSGNIQWATYFGGAGLDIGNGVATDLSGNVYVSGSTSSATGIATPGAYRTTYSGGPNVGDAFLSKFSSNGILQWATYYGGSKNESSSGVATDGIGNIYIIGYTLSDSGIATPGAHQTIYKGGTSYGDVFLAKFDTSGTLKWATYYGGKRDEQGYAIATDIYGNALITGYTSSDSGIATNGAYEDTVGSIFIDAYLAKFDSTGTLQWGTYYGVDFFTFGYGLATDSEGNIFATGSTASRSGITTAGAYQTSYPGGDYAVYLAKFNTNGTIQWATYYGDTLGQNKYDGHATNTDRLGNVYVVGEMLTPPCTGSCPSYAHFILAKFSNSGIFEGDTSLGGNSLANHTMGNGVTADRAGNIYVTGSTDSTTNVATTNVYQPTKGGGDDAFLAKFRFNELATIIDEPLTKQNLSVFPNPTQNNVTIVSRNPIMEIEITDLLGQAVYHQAYYSNKVLIELGQLHQGVYILKINGTEIYKIVKQ